VEKEEESRQAVSAPSTLTLTLIWAASAVHERIKHSEMYIALVVQE
jgi:hypothetical protein